ncbi:MAG TPA: cyclic nucleotide-binding domain-containing protein [Candidatus Hydrogenedens sp.]|nr:cyclic nucleotide-binding domain-containing protein [Candidatus Hydrogenedens sp.]HOK09520.1 cyclic nucleotide-binding domain-containing protein [Candidatus Hydrogenedens sp.]HOL18794.1 cyclic nucleotide-binding domain-containing protein [Candidatus Hydrogenedens sp.]HPP58383.1 cyclic nucleotide-binding domain-containing protein [Candidatus Hydrogenedens sp.]
MDDVFTKQEGIVSALFKGLSSDEVERLFDSGLIVHFKKDEVVFYQGSMGNHVYLILSGSVGVYRDEKQIVTLDSGEIFGEMALFTKEPRSATVKVLQDSQLLIFSETSFHKLLTKQTAVRLLLNIINILCERLKKKNEE